MIQPRFDHNSRLTGIALMCVAVALFACLDATAKYVGQSLPPLQVVAIRFLAGFLLALAVSNPLTAPGAFRTTRPRVQVIRGLLLAGTTLCNFLSFKYLQLDEALAVMFSTPFLVAALAGPILGEWIGWRRWVAIGIGFCGVLLVIRPGLDGFRPAFLISVASAIIYASYAIATRMAAADSAPASLFFGNLIAVAVTLPILPFVWMTPETALQWVLLIATGAFGSAGHFMLIAAHRRAPASILSPFMYSQMIWAVTLGFVIFGHVPSHWTLAGAAVVVASGLYLLHRERVRGMRKTPPGNAG